MFLYREFVSEAIRILIPSTSLDVSTQKMDSFAAAIMLGLKKKFNNVDHLRYCIMDVPVPEGGYRKQYMVIFDCVPGGTGYLKQLMDRKEALMDVFALALEAMEHCPCSADPDRDGCYHCLFVYGQGNRMSNISRRCATELLRKILSGRNTLERIKGISSIAVNTLLESELERCFIEAIEQCSWAERKAELTKVPVNGKEGYFLQIGPCCWEIELQVPLGAEMGVAVSSKADFVFWPRSKGNRQRPVVVFTDGFSYHKDTVDEDTNKRLAIRKATGYPVWALTWQDVEGQLLPARPRACIDALHHGTMPMGKQCDAVVRRRGVPALPLREMTSFDLLLQYLAEPNADALFTANAQALAIAMLETAKVRNEEAFRTWNEGYDVLPTLDENIREAAFEAVLFGTRSPADSLHIFSCLPVSAVSYGKNPITGKPVLSYDETRCSLVVRFDDTAEEKDNAFKADWSQYLYCCNVLQFAGNALCVTKLGLAGNLYSWLAAENAGQQVHVAETGKDHDDEWSTIVSERLFDQDAINLARKMQSAGCLPPSCVGYELEGNVLAEMLWEEQKIAVQLDEQSAFKELLLDEGWRVFTVTSPEALPAVKGA